MNKMSFEKELALTMIVVTVISFMCCGILLVRLDRMQDKVRVLEIEIGQTGVEYD